MTRNDHGRYEPVPRPLWQMLVILFCVGLIIAAYFCFLYFENVVASRAVPYLQAREDMMFVRSGLTVSCGLPYLVGTNVYYQRQRQGRGRVVFNGLACWKPDGWVFHSDPRDARR